MIHVWGDITNTLQNRIMLENHKLFSIWSLLDSLLLNNNYYFHAITSVAILSWPNSSKCSVFRESYGASL